MSLAAAAAAADLPGEASGDMVILVAKYPTRGKSKTRLIPHFGEAVACEVAQAMLSDKLTELAASPALAPAARVLLFAPPSADEDVSALLHSLGVASSWRAIPMASKAANDLNNADLGQKLARGLEDARTWVDLNAPCRAMSWSFDHVSVPFFSC